MKNNSHFYLFWWPPWKKFYSFFLYLRATPHLQFSRVALKINRVVSAIVFPGPISLLFVKRLARSFSKQTDRNADWKDVRIDLRKFYIKGVLWNSPHQCSYSITWEYLFVAKQSLRNIVSMQFKKPMHKTYPKHEFTFTWYNISGIYDSVTL